MRFVVHRFILFTRVLFTIRLSIRFVVYYGALYARSQSILGQIVLFCARRYHRSINDVIYNQVNSCIITSVYNSVDYATNLATNLLTAALLYVKRSCILFFQWFLAVS